MHELPPEANNRLYELEQALLKLGDGRVEIEENNLQSPLAHALRVQGLTLLKNARAVLDTMYKVELEYAQLNASSTETH